MPQFYFSLPRFELLTPAQRAAIAEIKPIALSGGPGTGKSVVSLWRHIINHQKEKPTRSQLLTFTKTLAHYLKECSRTQSEDAAKYVDSAKHWRYYFLGKIDEIIIDEAQDLPLDFNEGFKNYSSVISYGADNKQILVAEAINQDGSYNLLKCSPEEDLNKLFGNTLHHLPKNFRSTLSIMKFVRDFFPYAPVSYEVLEGLKSKVGELPRLLIANGDLNKQNAAILNLVNEFSTQGDINIAILVPFANRPREGAEHLTVNYFFNLLNSNNIECSSFVGDVNSVVDIKNIHITTFKSSKGLEFDVVILPNFQIVNQNYRVINWRDFYVREQKVTYI